MQEMNEEVKFFVQNFYGHDQSVLFGISDVVEIWPRLFNHRPLSLNSRYSKQRQQKLKKLLDVSLFAI